MNETEIKSKIVELHELLKEAHDKIIISGEEMIVGVQWFEKVEKLLSGGETVSGCAKDELLGNSKPSERMTAKSLPVLGSQSRRGKNNQEEKHE